MKVRDICGVVEDVYAVYDRVVYYEDIHEYGTKYLGRFSDIKDSIMDCEVCRIYPYDSDCIDIEVTSNNILHTNAKIINYSGKYVNNHGFDFANNLLSCLVYKNSDVNYICYGVSWPENKYENGEYIFFYKEFIKELCLYEESIKKDRLGKVIMAFNYNGFFTTIFEERNEQAKKVKDYMVSNGWVFDIENILVYKIIVL